MEKITALGSVQPSVMICVGISLIRIGCVIQFELLRVAVAIILTFVTRRIVCEFYSMKYLTYRLQTTL